VTPLAADVPRKADAALEGGRRRRERWWLLLPLVFIVYSISFVGLPVLEQRYDALGDGDTAAMIPVIEDFGLGTTYGDPYRTEGRSVADVAQKHKIHHVPYLAIAAGLYAGLSSAYDVLGLEPRDALYAINALIACLNLLLLATLMRGRNPNGNPLWPFLALYAFALSTWVFASVPEHWPFSATLVLTFLLALQRSWLPPLGLAALVGLAMVDNIMLGFLVAFIALEDLRQRGLGRAVVGFGVYVAAAVATWAVVLSALSVFDPMFRPDHFLEYTFWFKEYTARDLPPWDPYVWKSAISNLFVTSVASNQPDPAVPQVSTLYTLQGSLLGLAAIAAWVALLLLAVWRAVQWLRGGAAGEGGAEARRPAPEARAPSVLSRGLSLLAEPRLRPAVFCLMMTAITGLLYYTSGFLYSTLVVPVLALGLASFLDLRRRPDRVLLYLMLALLIVNNTDQVLAFRAALAAAA